MIELIELSKSYNTSNKDTKKALTNINLKFDNKGLVTILGNSGSGKTTLMNLIAGIVKPTAGTIVYESIDSNSIKDSDYDYLRNHYFGFVFQDMYLIETLTVYENIDIALKLQGLNDVESNIKILESLTLLNINDLVNNKISELSGGEKQRVNIARSIAKGAKVILADEPASFLDKDNSHIIYNYLQKISKSVLVIMVSHDEDNALKISDRIIRMEKGEVVYDSMKNTEYSIQKLPNNNKIKTMNLALKTNKYINRKQGFRYFFTCFFWVVSILSSMIALNLILLKTPNFIYTTNLEVNNIGYKIVDDLFNTDENNFDYNKIDQTKYPTIKFSDYYKTENFFIEDFLVNKDSVNTNEYYGNDIFNTIIIKNMNRFEVEITDFSASMMIHYQILPTGNVSSVVGQSFLYNGYEIKIVNLLNTNYDDYDTSKLNSDDDLFFNFKRNRDSTFKNITMSEETRRTILNSDILNNIGSNSINTTIKKHSISNEIDPYSMYGTIPMSDDEILVSLSYLARLVSEPNISIDQFDDFLNIQYEIELEYDGIYLNRNYTITGIVFTDNYTLYLNDGEFNHLKELIGYNKNNNDKNIYFEFGNKTETLLLIQDILDVDGYILANQATEIYYGYLALESFKTTAILLLYIVVTLLVMMLIYFTSNLIKINKYNIGVLSSLGFSKNNLAFIFGLENFKILSLSFLISLPLKFIIISLINQNYRKNLNISINIIKQNFWSNIIVYFVSLLVVLLIQIYTIRALRKRELINIIYD